MESENNIIEYLQGKLSDEQKKDFERRLENDPGFYKEYLTLKQMHSYLLERNAREKYTAEIDRLGTKHFQSDDKKSKISFKSILILATFLLSASFLAWYLLKPKNVNLYESNSEHFALHLVLKSDANTIAINAENAFNNGDFELATEELKKYLEGNSIDIKARLALGISYLETGNSAEAIKIFDEISDGQSTLRDYAIWYKALYYVKESDFLAAKNLILAIPKMDKQLYNKAQELLKDIETRESR